MSRRPRELVWFQWYGNNSSALCPVCEVNCMKKDDAGGETWHREHIVRLSLGGPDTYPNLIPICKSCNLAMGKSCKSTFDFMARKLEKISIEEARQRQESHLQLCSQFDPQCEMLTRTRQRCNNLKGGKCEQYCWKHIRSQLEAMDCSD
jgi:hypothetical protein